MTPTSQDRRMISGLLGKYLQITVFLIIFLNYLDLPSYLYIVNPALLPKYFFFAMFAMISPFIFLRTKEFTRYLLTPFSVWAAAEIVIYILDLPHASENVYKYILDYTQYFILDICISFSFNLVRTDSFEYLFPIVASIIAACVIFDFFNVGVFYPVDTELTVHGRASAMFINPTRAGEGVMMACLLAIPVMRISYRLPLLLFAGLAILLTFSRGSILIWMAFFLFLLATRRIPKYSYLVIGVIIFILPVVAIIFKSFLSGHLTGPTDIENVLERLSFFQKPSIQDDSGQERLQVLKAGWEIFADNPLFGAGSGSSTFWEHRGGPHNQFILVGSEHGVIGVGLWIWLMVIVARGRYYRDNSYQLVASLMLFAFSFFNHNMFGPLYWMLTYALTSGRRYFQDS
ncbi:MAG: O-antigen ligase family protein [Methylomonas sp.]